MNDQYLEVQLSKIRALQERSDARASKKESWIDTAGLIPLLCGGLAAFATLYQMGVFPIVRFNIANQ